MCFKMLAHAGVRSCMAVRPHPEGCGQGCACDKKLAVAEGWPLSACRSRSGCKKHLRVTHVGLEGPGGGV